MTAPLIAGDIEPTIKEWLISVVGPDVLVCYKLPPKWDLSEQPALVVRLVDETFPGYVPLNDTMMQLDCLAGPHGKATAAGIKATVLAALVGLELAPYVDSVRLQKLVGAYNTACVWAPDETPSTDGGNPGPVPRYSITTQFVAGKVPAT